MFSLSYKNQVLYCDLESTDYYYGLKIISVFYDEDCCNSLGKIGFITHLSECGLTELELRKGIKEALIQGRCESKLEAMLQWQSELQKLGYVEVAPISCRFCGIF